ncbi:MAG: ABC transporter substrate-binding protein [Desulfobacterales bacterium]|jgi:branched-chain amino acid transport system substrate-binding protein
MKNLVYFSILFSLVFWLDGCDQKPAIQPSGKIIKIGIIGPFSGPVLAYGTEGLKGMETARQLQPYLQNGDRVELVAEDDKNDPALTVEMLKKLVEKDRVSAIMTFSSSKPVLAMAKLADNYQTPVLAAVATHPDVTKDNTFISQLGFDDDFQGIVAALFVRDDLLVDTVAVFNNPTSVYSSHLAAEFERKFKSIGGEITDTISLTEGTNDLPEVIKGVYGQKPELLYLPISVKDVVRVVREVHKLNWKPEMMGGDGLISTMLAQHKEDIDLVDGMLATDFFAHGMPLTPFGNRARKKYRENYKETGTSYAALGAEGYAILLDAINRCSDPADRDCINRQIRSTTNFTGIIGNITIGSNGKAKRPLCINSIKRGRSKFIFKVY